MVVKVSKRQRQIMEMLLKRQNEITVAEIAEEIKVSSRTVHRELLEIESILDTFGITLLKKAGIGIQIQADRQQLDQLKTDLFRLDPEEYTPEERRILITCTLLEEEDPVKLFSLSHDLQAAIPTISSDLDEMEKWLERNGLTLIRKRGYGVEITGSEWMKRQAIGKLAKSYLDDSVLFGSKRELPVDPVTRRLLDMVGIDHFFRIEQALWKLEERYPTTLAEAAYTFLLIRLSIAMTRVSQGKRITSVELKEQDYNHLEVDSGKYEYFAELMQLELPAEEKVYMTELLQEWEGGSGPGLLMQEDLQQVEIVNRLIRYVEERLSVELFHDRGLKEGLLQHAGPVLKRIRNGESIRNPLLSQIKKDYESLFIIVKSAVQDIALDIPIPEEEVGFLVMHFGAALERIRQQSRNRKVRALLVCTSGIGSSKLLAVRLEKELPQIELLGHVSWFEAARIPEEDYDLVISTVDLPLSSGNYIKLSPLLSHDEVERLRSFIQDITLKRTPTKSEAPNARSGPSLKMLRNVTLYTQEIIKLIEQFQVFQVSLDPLSESQDLRSIVQDMCGIIQRRGGLEKTEDIVERLLKREKQGSQVIPHSGLALFHTRSETIRSPILALFRFDRPVQWEGLHGQEVRQILLMLGPKVMDKETLEVLSEVSAMLLEPEVIHMLEMDDEETIKRFFSSKFESFIKTKLEWRE